MLIKKIIMKDAKQIMEKMKRQRYTKLIYFKSKSGGKTKPHYHIKELKIVILRGSLRLTVNGKVQSYFKGDSIRVPPRAVHSGVAGKNGVECVEGNK